jgi:acetyl esterase/lipase
MPRISAPSTVSEAARRFIDEAPPLTPIDLSPQALAAQRRANLKAYGPPGEAVAVTLGVTTHDDRLSGVPVQWVVPPEENGDGVILYFFGGGYVYGSPAEDLAITARLAAFAGRKVCTPAYRLAPEHPFPTQRDEGLAVYRALLADHAPIAIAGESAGGNLALAVIGRVATAGLRMPIAAALLSPWSDLTHQGDTIRTLDGIDPTLSGQSGDAFARAFAGGRPLDNPEISPLFADVPKGFPPTLITSGTRDALLSDCARLSTRLRHAGVDAELRVWEGLWHVFEFTPDLPEAEASLREVAVFLRARLATNPS